MSDDALYPGADHKHQWGGQGGTTMSHVNKLLLHTTETAGWPGYGSFYPTLTYHPWLDHGQRWRQHHPINGSASTLKNAGSFKTNRANVVQVEIVAYCDLKIASKHGHSVEDIPVDALDELGQFWSWLHQEWHVPLAAAAHWKPYPASAGSRNGVRMSIDDFDDFTGACGHQHAPGNDHGDPGSLDVGAILAAAKKHAKQPDPADGYPTPTDNTVYVSKLDPGQSDSDSVWWAQKALHVPVTGTYDQATVDAVKAFQKSIGDKVDGDLGPLETAALFAQAGLAVEIRDRP